MKHKNSNYNDQTNFRGLDGCGYFQTVLVFLNEDFYIKINTKHLKG